MLLLVARKNADWESNRARIREYLQLIVSTAKAMGLQVPVTLQPQYSLLSREIEWEIVPAALHNGIGLLPWSPLARGFLTGKYQRGGTPPPGTRAGSEKPLYQWVSEEYANSDRNWATIDAVVRKEIGVTPTQVALSWIADRPGVIAPIVGARTVDGLQGSFMPDTPLRYNRFIYAQLNACLASNARLSADFQAGRRNRLSQWNNVKIDQVFVVAGRLGIELTFRQLLSAATGYGHLIPMETTIDCIVKSRADGKVLALRVIIFALLRWQRFERLEAYFRLRELIHFFT
jgi:hypothetical protein